MNFRNFFRDFPRNADGPAGGGGDLPPAADGSKDSGAPPAAPDGQAPAPAVRPSAYRPEGLPEHLAGTDDKETIDRLFRAFDGFRKSQGDRGEVPAEPKAYAYEPSETVKPYAAGFESDAFFGKVKERAHQLGMGQKQFQTFIDGVLSDMIGGGFVEDPFNPDAERAALVPDVTDPKERSARAEAVVQENIALIDVMQKRADRPLPANVATWLQTQMDRAAANQLVAWAASLTGEQKPALNGARAGSITEADLRKRNADPRNTPGNPTYDRAFAEETRDLYRQFYGDDPRAG